MSRSTILTVERLEDRVTPATYGFAWPDPQHLTISFVADGTAIGAPTPGAPATTSTLFATLGTANAAVWETQILKAFQTWAASANINFGLVADSGAPLGTAGSPLDNIRIAAAPLGSQLVATSVPYGVTNGGWSGTLIFNSNDFGPNAPTNYDLYTVALHEAGHILGLDNSSSPSSVMYPYYVGVRTGLSRQDVTALQTLYAPPPSGGFLGLGYANFTSTALQQYQAELSGQAYAVDTDDLTPLAVTGSIEGPLGTEIYSYQTTSTAPNFTIDLNVAGLSLLEARVTVVDGWGRIVASAAATDPLNNDLTLQITNANPNEQYFIAVQSNSSGVFGDGAYQVQIVPDNAAQLAAFDAAFIRYQAEGNEQGSFAAAEGLTQQYRTVNDRYDYLTQGTIAQTAQVNYYEFRAPNVTAGQTQTMTVQVADTDASGLAPEITVYDAGHNVVGATVVEEAAGVFAVAVANAVPGAVYYVAVQSADGVSTGRYTLGVDFSTRTTTTPVLGSGVLNPPAAGYPPQDAQAIQVAAATILQLNVTSSSPVAVAVFDQSTGQELYSFAATTNLSTTLYLPPGAYTIRFLGGWSASGTSYTATGTALNGPIGPLPIDPTQPPPVPPAPTYLWTQQVAVYFYSLVDAFGLSNPGGSGGGKGGGGTGGGTGSGGSGGSGG